MARGTASLHEPMNGYTGLKCVSRHYEIPGTGGFSDNDLEDIVQRIYKMSLNYKKSGYSREPRWRQFAAQIIGHRPRISYLAAKYRPGVRTIIWKDPLAVFLAGHPALRDIPVVVTVRNPFAVAASYKRMAWGNDVDEIAKRLKEIGLWTNERMPKPTDVDGYSAAENAAMLWDATYAYLMKVSRRKEKVFFVNIDQLIADPVTVYQGLYHNLGLEWSIKVEGKIRKDYAFSSSSSSVPEVGKAHDANRNIADVNTYWQKVMSKEEVEIVKDITQSRWSCLQDLLGSTVNTKLNQA